VTDPALDHPMLVLARELPCVGAGVRVRRAVGVALERDRRNGNVRGSSELALQLVILRLTFLQPESPAIVVDDDLNTVGVLEL
jgi:hypothetical protein